MIEGFICVFVPPKLAYVHTAGPLAHAQAVNRAADMTREVRDGARAAQSAAAAGAVAAAGVGGASDGWMYVDVPSSSDALLSSAVDDRMLTAVSSVVATTAAIQVRRAPCGGRHAR